MTTPTPEQKKPSLVKTLIPLIIIIGIAVGALFAVKTAVKTAVKKESVTGATGSKDTHFSMGEVGSVIEDFSYNEWGGQTKKFSQLQKKIVLINFWASWCEACMEEIPSMVKLWDAYKDKGFEILGINVDENPNSIIPSLQKKLDMRFVIGVDPEGKLGELFDVHAIPLSMIVGADRKVLFVESGERDWNDSEIRAKIETWLK